MPGVVVRAGGATPCGGAVSKSPTAAAPSPPGATRLPADPDRVRHSLATVLDERSDIQKTPNGVRVGPGTTETCARVMTVASDSGWTVAPAGTSGWSEPSRADVVLTTAGLGIDPDIRPQDLVATVNAGTQFESLQHQLVSQGMWLPIDPPGVGRTVGSVLATATAGPLRTGYGAIRDHVLGITMVTGNGRILRVGGSVVKNVAGFDLTRLAVGSFGAYGLITSTHLRLRAHPESDVTLIITGTLDVLHGEARAILATGLTPAALELTSPNGSRDDWTLALRLTGAQTTVRSLEQTVRTACSLRPERREAPVDEWSHWSEAIASAPVSIRIGTSPASLLDALIQCRELVGPGFFSVNAAGPQIRWAGNIDPEHIGDLRRRLAVDEIPVTVERAPEDVLNRTGHFGAYRSGVREILEHIRAVFDPRGTIAVPLEGTS